MGGRIGRLSYVGDHVPIYYLARVPRVIAKTCIRSKPVKVRRQYIIDTTFNIVRTIWYNMYILST